MAETVYEAELRVTDKAGHTSVEPFEYRTVATDTESAAKELRRSFTSAADQKITPVSAGD